MVRHGMEAVELVEHDDDADVAEPVDHVDRARGAVLERVRSGLDRIRRHPVLSAATVAVVVAAVVVPTVLSARADRLQNEALAALPGVAAPMGSAPDIAWTMPPSPGDYALLSLDRAWVRDDVLVLWQQPGDATSWLRGVDARTGDERWTAPLSSTPDLGDLGNRGLDDVTWCAAPTGASVLACLVTDSWELVESDDAGVPDMVTSASVRLRVLDVTTGETVLDRPAASTASFATIGTDIVLVETPEDGPASLVRLDPSTGATRWSADIPRPVDGAGSAHARVQVADDEISVGWLGTTALFTADGDAAGTLDADDVWHLRGHRVTPQGGAGAITQLRDLDTGRVLDLGGARPAWIATDDLSAPDLLLLQSDDHLTGRELATAQRVWRVDWPAESTLGLLIVDGMVARLADDGLTVIDAESGEQLWHRSVPAYGQVAVTDGRRLMVMESVSGTGPVVAAYDIQDGRLLWQVPVPVAVQSLAVVDNRLFGVGSGGVVAFGPETS